MTNIEYVIKDTDLILITGSAGFIGSRVVETLVQYGFRNLRCLLRPTSNMTSLKRIKELYDKINIQIFEGNLLSRDDCLKMTKDISIIYHLAAGRGAKSYPDAFMNSVVTTRNLLDAALQNESMKRFVNISSFTVYSNLKLRHGELLDETCETETKPVLRGEAYCYAKVKQEEIVMEYSMKHNIPFVILRPGAVYGPGAKGLTGRIGIDTFGVFLHMGGSNIVPLSYVDNCAEAIVLAGIVPGVNGEIFNIVDDDLPSSSQFLQMYKKNVQNFKSIYVPRMISHLLCYFWEKYSTYSHGQLPPAFNRRRWSSDWKGNRYSNEKLKKKLGWKPKISFSDAAKRHFEYQRQILRTK